MASESNETRLEYIQRINFVMDFIDKNLDQDLSLQKISHKALYSSFHFHRIFSAIVGETLNDFINRKRIERIASILLVGTEKPIKELAYSYGFNSESSFSRSFKKFYGISPTLFKSQGSNTLSKIGIEHITLEKYFSSIDNMKKWMDMNAQITIEELKEMHLAGITQVGDFSKMGDMFQKLMKWAAQNGALNMPAFKAITIYHDNPSVTQTSKVRYSACVTIDSNINLEGEIRKLTVSKGKYAKGRFEIGAEDFPKAWESMCIWVVENGYEFRDGEYFEIYHNDSKTHPEQKFIVDFCIPVNKDALGQQQHKRTQKTNNLSSYRKQIKQGQVQLDYSQLVSYIKKLRTYFRNQYEGDFIMGTVYQGSMDFSYISFTTKELKSQKLKFVLIFNHKLMRFEICLSGQNKQIRKKYWDIFKESNWDKYHLAESINDELYIMDHVIVHHPNFDDTEALTLQIETESLKFINEIRGILE